MHTLIELVPKPDGKMAETRISIDVDSDGPPQVPNLADCSPRMLELGRCSHTETLQRNLVVCAACHDVQDAIFLTLASRLPNVDLQ